MGTIILCGERRSSLVPPPHPRAPKTHYSPTCADSFNADLALAALSCCSSWWCSSSSTPGSIPLLPTIAAACLFASSCRVMLSMSALAALTSTPPSCKISMPNTTQPVPVRKTPCLYCQTTAIAVCGGSCWTSKPSHNYSYKLACLPARVEATLCSACTHQRSTATKHAPP